MKRIAFFLVAGFLFVGNFCLFPLPAHADDLTSLTITSYTKQREVKVSGGTWLYSYKVEVSNGGTEALSNVCAKVSSNSTSVRVVDPEVCFPDIPAGGRVASRGTFTLSVDKKSYTPPANLSWTYSSIHISASPSSLAMEKGAQVSLTYTVTLSTSAPKPYVVAFFQSVPEGVTTTTVPSGWTTNQSATWQFTEQVTGVNPTKTSLTARAIILNTIQQAKVTVPIYVAAPLPAIGTPAAWPTAIPVGTSPVRFTVSAPDRPANITLREQTMGDIATLYDNGANGDARANDGIYSGNATIRAEAEGVLSFRATSGGLTSDPCYLTVTSFPFGPAPADPAMILPDANGNKLVVNHIIVSFAPGTLPSRITEILDNDAVRGRVVGVLGVPGYYHVEVLTDTVSDLLSAVAALKTYPEVLTAGPDYVGDTSGGPLDPINDPSYGEQWAVRDIGANYSWRASRGQGVKVAVIDKGVDYNHTELSGRVILGTNYTVLEGDVNRQNPMDESSQSHGTHVAGIIASALDNTGIAGIAPEVQIVAIKACSDSIGCPAANVAHAITEAVTGANAAPIINLSLWIVRDPVCDADPQCENSVEQAIIGASPLALIVASAGNDGDGDPDGAGPLTGPPLWNPVYPAAYDEVNLRGIAVAASVSAEPTEDPTYNSNRIWKGSHYGPKVHLTAPGFAYYNGANKHIYALARVAMGSYARRYGSSQAAAHVSGVAALLMQVRSTWPRWSANPSEPTIRKQLLDTADAAPFKCPANPPNTTYCVANGKVNAKNAVPTEPVIVWSNPAPITYGTTLSATQLNAVAQDLYDDTPLDATVGTLSYSPPAETLLNAGTHTLSVTFTPNDLTKYSVSTKTVEIVVGKANATFDIDGWNGTYDGTAHGATGTATGVNNENLSVLLTFDTTYNDVPGGQVHWTFNGGVNYNDASGVVDIVISKASQSTLNIEAPTSMIYGALPVSLGTTGGSGTGGVTYGAGTSTGCSVSGTTLSVTNASGNCSITATKAGDGNYQPAYATTSVALQKAAGSVSVSVIPSRADYGDSFTPTFTKLGDGMASVFSSTINTCTVTAGVVNYVDIGTCTLVASVAEGTNHLSATGTPQSFTVAKLVGIVAGNTYTVGLKSDGTVVAVGYNHYGQLNVDTWTGITQVTAGYQHTVGLKSDGTVVAVGYNDYGQLNVDTWTGITQVAAGYIHTVGLRSDGTVVAVGYNDYGQLNAESWTGITQVAAGFTHTVGLRSDGTVVAVGRNLEGQLNVDTWTGITQVAAGGYHTVGLKSDGTVVAVGRNLEGQLNVDTWTGITQVAAFYLHTVGLKSDGTVVAVGRNLEGQLNVDTWTGITQVAAGGYHTVGLKSDGTVVAVGRNLEGQLNVEPWTNIVQVAAGGSTVGLKSDGTVVAVGENGAGQLNVESWTNIVQVATGFTHTVGLRSDGTVVAVGENGEGQLNVESWTNIVQVAAGYTHTVGLRFNGTVVGTGSEIPIKNVDGWTDIVHVTVGTFQTLGLKSDGTVVAVGENGEGQLNVESWTNIVQVATGNGHTMGLRSDGTVVAVGNNDYGQLDVESWTGVTQVAAGYLHTLGLKSDGTVVAVGNNGYGQLNVESWTGVTQVAAGNTHTVGLRSDSTVLAVGRNDYGQYSTF